MKKHSPQIEFPFTEQHSPRQRHALVRLRAYIKKVQRKSRRKRLTIDFETKCELNIKKVGGYKYSQHKSCEVLMMSYSLTGKAEDTRLWQEGDPPPQGLFALLASEKYALNAFNSYFEYCVWRNVCVPKMGWPEIDIEDIYDTMDKCKALALPANLDDATKVTQVEHEKDPKGKALIKLFCEPRTRGGEIYFNDRHSHPVEWGEFCYYCIQDTKATIALDNILPNLSHLEQAYAWLTDRMNWRGVYVDMAAALAGDKLSQEVKVHYNAEAAKLCGGAFLKCTQRAKVKTWLAENGLSLPNMRGDTIDVAMRRDDLPPQTKRMLELYKIAGGSATAKYAAMGNYIADDGRVHELLNYHKARTGRFGGKGMQIQNLKRPVLPKCTDYEEAILVIKSGSLQKLEAYAKRLEAEDKANSIAKGKSSWWTANPMDVLSSCIRAVITSMFGAHFKCADYSAIEARVLLWLAGDERALDIFRRNEDIYLDMASQIYSIPLKSLTKESDERPLGKEAILGCGYGMGHKKFRTRCDEVAGIKLTAEMAQHTVKTYRESYKSVTKYWAELEAAAIKAVRFEGQMTACGGTRFMVKKMGKMKILLCKFPSGHTTGYPYPSIKTTEKWGRPSFELRYQGNDSMTQKWGSLHTYGGKLVENVTQGVARDLICFGMVLLELEDYELVMSVHDEVVSEDEDDFGSLEDFEHLMCTLPAWAGTLPVVSEGWQGVRYRK